MSGVSFPVTRPIGRALVVANPSTRVGIVAALSKLGFECGECDDPYTAVQELCHRRLAYRALILSLASLYREELSLIATVKRRFPHVEIWLAHTDGRQAALAESMRLGADGLLDDEGLHRIAAAQVREPVTTYHPMPAPQPQASAESPLSEPERIGEPVLTADELRALLQDQPAMPPSGTVEKES
jgi:DNA-binding NarL/FixJ family response regulator